MPLLKVSTCLTVRTLSEALLGRQAHRRDRDFSWVRKPASLTCSEILQKCEIDTETQTTEWHFTQLLQFQTPEIPLPATRGETDLCPSAMRWRISPLILRKQN